MPDLKYGNAALMTDAGAQQALSPGGGYSPPNPNAGPSPVDPNTTRWLLHFLIHQLTSTPHQMDRDSAASMQQQQARMQPSPSPSQGPGLIDMLLHVFNAGRDHARQELQGGHGRQTGAGNQQPQADYMKQYYSGNK